MLIRPATVSDAAAWREMREDLWPGSKNSHAEDIERYFAGKSRDPLHVLLAFDEHDSPAGFIELSIRAYAEGCVTDHVAFIEGWYVVPAMRGRGVGADLIREAESWAGSQGCAELGSDAEAENLSSAAAHRAVGFEEAGVVRCFRKSLSLKHKPSILVVTGASGVGKTTAVQSLERRGDPAIRCFYFDSIGVPSAEIMQRDFGEPESWQAGATQHWIARLAQESGQYISVLDAQTRPSFVRDALAEMDPMVVRIVLLECSPLVRHARLVQRGQSELATEQMNAWAVYLRGQADALGLPVIDTSSLAVSEMTVALLAEIETLRSEGRRT